ncbi:dynamin family protein [Calothrix sp. 336/3]|uniref:dynamin family protein n=1 Tax=Calothrix sp. 336/3 TaxID=1337936 RepID=UPI0004E2C1A1|nr:dynamin family protein [Calothrix sp. 336/3]AKG21673.1 hypothetical protein IJ00_10750 [Calothrix sp. 336/3]
MSQPNFKALKQDVLDLLKEVGTLMGRASKVMENDKTNNKYMEFQQLISNEAHNVRELELRMTIVAPMKAGKSTIVNAIAGQDILPSRNSAMTTLPTEVIFDHQVKQPTLILEPQIIEVFQDTLSSLREKIKIQKIEEVQQIICEYPHLTHILEKIKNSHGLKITAETQGRENIIDKLSGLNDIIRLCNNLDPQADPLLALKHAPKIKTPLPRFQDNSKNDEIGKLVIVDTPGPNEAGKNLKLKGVVEEQLRKSSIVLIVLDFTQLKTEAAEKVKKDVQTVIDIRGKENLYVLINKVDQRRKEDMTTEQLQQFVAAEFGIGGSKDVNRVFEISARRAFTATNFLIESHEMYHTELAKMKTVQTLMEEAYPLNWEDKIEETNLEELRDLAGQLLKKSKFDSFMDGAIDALIAKAAPRCIQSALKITGDSMTKLEADIHFRQKALNQEEDKLKDEIEAFETELKKLENFRQNIQNVETIKEELLQKISQQIDEIKNKAKYVINNAFTKESEKNKNHLEIMVQRFLPFISSSKQNNVLEFKEEYTAKLFAEQAIASTKEIIEPLLETELKSVEKSIETQRQNLAESLGREIKPIIQWARQRLRGLDLPDLTIEILLPMPDLYSRNSAISRDVVKGNVKTRDGGYETKVIEKRTWRHWLWVIPKKETIYVKQPDINENYYTVFLQEIVDKSNQFIENSIQEIQFKIANYVDDEFKQGVENFFDEFGGHLSDISQQFNNAYRDQKGMENKTRESLVAEFNSLISEVKKKNQEINQMLSRVPK